VPRIAIVGAGQSGLQLALGLLAAGCDVTVVSNRSAEEIATGPVLSSQCMFESALQTERALGLNYWEEDCPPVEGIAFSLLGPAGDNRGTEWAAQLDWPAQSVDQRLKIPRWIKEFETGGGTLLVHEAGLDDLEQYARNHDLVIVATGRGALGNLFGRDSEKSRFNTPQRALALTYVTGVEPRPEFSAVSFSVAPAVGEYFVFPALTTSGTCEIMVFEGIPAGPMDCWNDVRSASDHLQRSLEILQAHFPVEAARCNDAELTDANGVLTGRIVPTVRNPVAVLPSGAAVLGMADAVVMNDPITGQGSNHAAKCAETYLEIIRERIADDGSFDVGWMQQTFERYWRGYAQWAVAWTNSMLAPPQPHVLRLLQAAAELPALATTIANGFDDPRVFFPWWFDANEADRLVAEKEAQAAEQFDPRELRRALGQFATGVTVITTCAENGHRIGVTANSFTSLSLDPPLVLWCLSKTAPSRGAFEECSHFAVNVLAAGQHYLSRQFATPAEDKFGGVDFDEGPGGVPVIDGVLAYFVCRNVRHVDGGDHLIVIGEVERFETTEGEPLVFHSGKYRVATRHPELEPGAVT
jgi:flavin reductase (DIM6/NTAB) family NADH-FMN oxidoreductase RutF